ncbi:MAG TPA: hypothetical protein DEF04_01950 [Clostridiales bacterium]|nr:hypothetical protein [Clostridiales bacterium]
MVGQTHKIPNLCDVGADKLVNFPANLVFDRQQYVNRNELPKYATEGANTLVDGTLFLTKFLTCNSY